MIVLIYLEKFIPGTGTLIETGRVAVDRDLDPGQRVDLNIDQGLVLAQVQRGICFTIFTDLVCLTLFILIEKNI